MLSRADFGGRVTNSGGMCVAMRSRGLLLGLYVSNRTLASSSSRGLLSPAVEVTLGASHLGLPGFGFGCAAVVGSPHAANGYRFNSATLIGSSGRVIGRQHKVVYETGSCVLCSACV